jgi:cobalt/nickel transport system ATP-binding protein
MSGDLLEVRELHYSYPDGTPALKGVSFRLAAGAALALVGGNGAGKSTLLMHLNGALTPSRGEVLIEGQTIARSGAAARGVVGTVFQDPDDQLFMPTVFEDVAFGPLNAGLAVEEVEACAAAALERVGAAHLRERPPFRLSAGEKRAAAIATALALSPRLLVMDEPSSHLDPRGRRRLIEFLKSYEHARIIATHDLELAFEVCPEALILDDGRVVAGGPTCELLNDEALMLAHGLERPHILRHCHPH